ncbi:NAD(P)H:quinone oxidoreductase [Idiomarina tyrosinivorans]|uniref:NAD(P)H:quinone oxidoreductase n=1 Tax=Idiomarina tyrosinivorans TaxID=1445662 RepID=A0A432ZU79_9GAMM|nr:NAD(P)H:quinone oxidoreductase [Idiomarina tyrosinivorans]RUO81470.1 NAD(P)H:quinone oxidoreductase [Idiomarina tyrosinivorans]
MSCRIVIFYFSRHGATQQLADAIAEGVSKAGAEPLMRTVESDSEAKSARDISISRDDLKQCDGLILGSPTRFGHMASGLQKFWESTSSEWLAGALEDKPGAVFTSSQSLHGGQESTLLTLALPLLHHGMTLVGIPYSEPAVQQTQSGGSPYGASHVDGISNTLSAHERQCAIRLGQRVSQIAKAMQELPKP